MLADRPAADDGERLPLGLYACMSRRQVRSRELFEGELHLAICFAKPIVGRVHHHGFHASVVAIQALRSDDAVLT
jgi:hypothetical protein